MSRRTVAMHIDFQQRAPAAQRRMGWLLLALGMVMLAIAYHRHADVTSDIVQAQAQAAARAASGGMRSAVSAESQAAGDAARAARAAYAQLAAPWGALFSSLEAAADGDVALLVLQADGSGGALRISGEARTFAALVAYLRRLQAIDLLRDVRLAGHEVRHSDARGPVAFDLVGAWRSAP